VPLYPRLLANTIDDDMQPVVDELERAGCRGDQLRLIAWEASAGGLREARKEGGRGGQ
jgi:hypothetical protein